MAEYSVLGLEMSCAMTSAVIFLSIIALGANAKLFIKCDQPVWAALIPGYNVVVAMRILGRPDQHAVLFLIPVFNIYFFLRTVIELAQAFGKRTNTDYALAMVFNVFYVLNLSLAYQEEYVGPVYGQEKKTASNLQAA